MNERTFGGPGYPVVEKALETIQRHRMFGKGETIVVAVSGGPDSVCLLDVLHRISIKMELTIHVAHVDHDLADGSDVIAGRVATRAAEAGFDVHVVKAPGLEGPNLHARAREFRYGFFDIVCSQTGATKIATGHTLDDRVETTMARLIHGAGTSVLAGIKPVDGNRIHPLIDIRRPETRSYCEELVLEFTEDPANTDHRFERPRIRELVIEAIEKGWGEGAIRAIATSSGRLAEDSGALDGIAERLFEEVAVRDDAGVSLPLQEVSAVPRAIRRRLLESAVGRVRDRSGGIEAVLDALDRGIKEGARFSLAQDREIEIAGDRIIVGGAPGEDASLSEDPGSDD